VLFSIEYNDSRLTAQVSDMLLSNQWREKIAESFPLKGRADECFFFLFLDTFLEYFCF
jgi:hypothetical protein